MDGRALAERVRGEVAGEVGELGELGLATILVGDDPASEIYIRHKHAAAQEAGVLALVSELNADESVDGILVQTPLPSQLDEARVMRTIEPTKDVDGLHPLNAGQLYFGRPTLVPATPLGVMRLLHDYGVALAGAQ